MGDINQTAYKDVKDEEVDLSKTFSSIGSFFRKSFGEANHFISSYSTNYIKRLKLVLGIIVLCIIAGAIRFYSVRPYYESSVTIYSEYFKGELLDNTIKNLNMLCEEGNYGILSQRLDIPESNAQNIKGFSMRNLIPSRYKKLIEMYSDDKEQRQKLDSLLLYDNQSTYQILVEVYDTSAYRNLDSALVNYIRKNEYVKRRVEIDRINIESFKNKIGAELKKLDTLKLTTYRNISAMAARARNGNNSIILADQNSANPLEIFKEDISLYQQGLDLDRKLFLNNSIEVIEGFIPFCKPKSASLYKNVFYGAILGLIISGLIVLFITLKPDLVTKRNSFH